MTAGKPTCLRCATAYTNLSQKRNPAIDKLSVAGDIEWIKGEETGFSVMKIIQPLSEPIHLNQGFSGISVFGKNDSTVSKFQKELNAGTIALVVLSVLERCGELYGYDIVRQLDNGTEDSLPMNQSAVYPVLRSLEKQGLLSSRMQPSDVGPARKYYRLTKKGNDILPEWKLMWTRSVQIVNRILTENNDGKSTNASSGDRKVSKRT